jgi:PKD repeat protein
MSKKNFIAIAMALIGGLLSSMTAPANAATEGEIDDAIQDGLAWLASQQRADGSFGQAGWDYYLANTATVVLAFQNEGHFAGGGSEYSDEVGKGLDYIFQFGHKIGINKQTYGYAGRNDDPDTNGNGQGIYFGQSAYMYETGIVMQALIASNTPNRVVSIGDLAGMTYREVMEDLVDFCAWAQIDGSNGRGGWRYNYYNNSPGYGDNSVSQWPTLGLVAAEQWGIYAPQFVKDEMQHWVTFIQDPVTGGSGYDVKSSYQNVAKTGGLLVEFYYLGDDRDTPRVKKAIDFINAHWNEGLSGWEGNLGHPYAMFGVFKGLELMNVTEIPNALANSETLAGDWWGHYCEFLVNDQIHVTADSGYWNGYDYAGQYLATPWYIVILQATIFPISVDVIVPGTACTDTGYDVSIEYSVERFTANGTLKVYRDDVLYDTITLTDFQGSDTVNYNIPNDDIGVYIWKAVLNVTGGGITMETEDSASGEAYENPQVSGIPSQYAPFSSFDLDDYQTCECTDVTWQALNVPDGWTVTIDADNVVTIVAPADDVAPAEITFEATFHWEPIDCVDSASATFYPNRPPVADAGKDYGAGEYYEVFEGRTVELDGSNSYDPDGDELISYEWDLDEDGTFETPSTDGFTTFSAAGYDAGANRIRMYVFLKVVDEHGAEDIAQARVQIYDQAPTAVFSAPSEPQLDCTAVQFTDQSTSEVDDIVSWAWDFGGLGSSTEQNPSFTFTDAGDHNVCLTVTDDDGSTDTACKTVTVLDVPPTALAKDITVQLDSFGKALISADDIDNGSSDTCGIASMTVAPSEFTCADLGDNTVTLEVTDANGNTGTATAVVTVEDTRAPSIEVNAPATITPPDAPISFTATATENCSAAVEITDYSCYGFTGSGKQHSKMQSCVVSVSGDTITITDSGGVGDNIVWTIVATDQSGNETTAEGRVTVENPGGSKRGKK